MRDVLIVSVCLLAAACGGEPPARDPGPPPGDGHRDAVRVVVDRLLGERYELDGAPSYRFAAPVADRVARWHFEPHLDGEPHAFGYVHGFRVDLWVTPSYVGYPPQPEKPRMAFFTDGALRGVFAPGGDGAPLELDRWAALWVDPGFSPDDGARPARPASGR